MGKADETRLKEALERFKTASAVLQKGETREVPLVAVRPEPPATAAVPEPPEPVHEAAPQPQAGAPSRDLGLIDRVFELDRQGLSAAEISERLRIDPDRVGLILKFKQ
jgi:hypothetical protein